MLKFLCIVFLLGANISNKWPGRNRISLHTRYREWGLSVLTSLVIGFLCSTRIWCAGGETEQRSNKNSVSGLDLFPWCDCFKYPPIFLSMWLPNARMWEYVQLTSDLYVICHFTWISFMTHREEAEELVSLPFAPMSSNTLKSQLYTRHVSGMGQIKIYKSFKKLYYANFETNKSRRYSIIKPMCSSRNFNH